MHTKRIAITGPESTGKSQLCEQLAAHYNGLWLPEYSREYLEGLSGRYTQQDIEAIARKHLAREQKLLAQQPPYLFIDTELINIKIWIEHFFGECPNWIQEALLQQTYDLYLLMDIDLPWEADPLREHPKKREHFMQLFEQELNAINATYQQISGSGEARVQNAIAAIEQLS